MGPFDKLRDPPPHVFHVKHGLALDRTIVRWVSGRSRAPSRKPGRPSIELFMKCGGPRNSRKRGPSTSAGSHPTLRHVSRETSILRRIGLLAFDELRDPPRLGYFSREANAVRPFDRLRDPPWGEDRGLSTRPAIGPSSRFARSGTERRQVAGQARTRARTTRVGSAITPSPTTSTETSVTLCFFSTFAAASISAGTL